MQAVPKIKRDKLVQVRISADELDEFRRFCGVLDVGVSEGLRRVIAACCGDGAMLTHEDRELFSQVAEEFRAIGVNINQAVRAMNTGRVPDQVALRQDLADLSRGMMALGGDLARQGARARRAIGRGVLSASAARDV